MKLITTCACLPVYIEEEKEEMPTISTYDYILFPEILKHSSIERIILKHLTVRYSLLTIKLRKFKVWVRFGNSDKWKHKSD